MTKNQAKTEAEKIVQEFYNILADQTTNLDCWEIAKKCAIIHVKGILKEIEFIHDRMIKSDLLAAAGAIYSRIQHYESILTELEKK